MHPSAGSPADTAQPPAPPPLRRLLRRRAHRPAVVWAHAHAGGRLPHALPPLPAARHAVQHALQQLRGVPGGRRVLQCGRSTHTHSHVKNNGAPGLPPSPCGPLCPSHLPLSCPFLPLPQLLYYLSSFFAQLGPNCTTFLTAGEVRWAGRQARPCKGTGVPLWAALQLPYPPLKFVHCPTAQPTITPGLPHGRAVILPRHRCGRGQGRRSGCGRHLQPCEGAGIAVAAASVPAVAAGAAAAAPAASAAAAAAAVPPPCAHPLLPPTARPADLAARRLLCLSGRRPGWLPGHLCFPARHHWVGPARNRSHEPIPAGRPGAAQGGRQLYASWALPGRRAAGRRRCASRARELPPCAALACLALPQYSNYRGEAVNPRYLSLYERLRR